MDYKSITIAPDYKSGRAVYRNNRCINIRIYEFTAVLKSKRWLGFVITTLLMLAFAMRF